MIPGGFPAEALRLAAARRADLARELRRALHRIPELAFEEHQTTQTLAEFFAARGLPFEPLPSGTGGVVAVGPGSGPAVLLRADLDALPIAEETPVPHRSVHPGRMHACGHDAHAAMLAAAADALAAPSLGFRGRAVCLFQPAEEGPGGCVRVLDDGLLERHPCKATAALHVWPELPVGTVGLSPGPVMAGMDRVSLTLHGKGGHGAYPQACIDPVVMAAETVLSLQTLVSRSLNPWDAGLLTLGSIHGGTAANIIPDSVAIDGTIRFYLPRVRTTLVDGLRRVAAGVASAYGGTADVTLSEGYPVTANHPRATQVLSRALTAALGSDAVKAAHRTMGAEDMAFLLARLPGCYVQLGSGTGAPHPAPLHSPRFDLDERCLEVGVTALLAAAFAFEECDPLAD